MAPSFNLLDELGLIVSDFLCVLCGDSFRFSSVFICG